MRLLVAVAVLVAVLAVAGVARALTERQGAMVDSTVRFLQESQRASGGFANPGQKANHDISSWVALALASAGINPQDQARCGTDAFTYLADFQEGLEEEPGWPKEIPITAYERELMTVDASGTDAHDFGGVDLVAKILEPQAGDGGFPHVAGAKKEGANDTIFAIIALSPIREGRVERAIEAAREWVVGAQDEDGGWYFSGKSAVSEVDMTGAALEALVDAGAPGGEPARATYERAISRGLAYLHEAQLPDGGFPALPKSERESNVASTAWAVQGIWATGGNPETWLDEGREPLDYMESMQQPDGHVRWRASSDMNGIWMTSYVTPAFAGQALPVPPAARSSPSATKGAAAACVEAGKEEGESKEAAKSSEHDVLTGGGGHGAPAFSRPKAQSKGRTPGGARIVHGQGLRARDHSPSRRGANTHQARGTEKQEPTRAAEADQEVSAVSAESAAELAARERAQAEGHEGGSGGDEGKKAGDRGAPLPGEEGGPGGSAGEDVDGTVIGSPEGAEGKLAFGAPGLRGAAAGGGDGLGAAIGIGIAALLAAGFGVGWERRRGRLA